ncbi:transglutaminase domain-containing protein, partial [bacterium]|nr:transglutaminase domain-containing protein [bacterium]
NWVEVYFDEYGWVAYDPTVMATEVSVYNTKGELLRVEKRYETSHDDQQYIQSGINLFTPYFVQYSIEERRFGNLQVQQKISITRQN